MQSNRSAYGCEEIPHSNVYPIGFHKKSGLDIKQEDINDIDVDEFLAEVEKLAIEAGDWRQHLPY